MCGIPHAFGFDALRSVLNLFGHVESLDPQNLDHDNVFQWILGLLTIALDCTCLGMIPMGSNGIIVSHFLWCKGSKSK